MKKINLIIVTLFLISSVGCQKYLEEEPKKQTSIQTVDQLEALLNNATAFTNEGHNPAAAYSTDDTEIPMDAFRNKPNGWSIQNLYHYVFDVKQVESTASDALWSGEYKKIFTANLVLFYLDKVKGSDAAKEVLKADAHFIRAYSYWVLANHYCLPYSNANLNALGLPLKNTIDYSESLKRATLKETYDFIESDIQEAAKTTVQDVNPAMTWRISQKGIQAFLSRYYLFTGDYEKSIQNADLALGTQSAHLVDFRSIQEGKSASYANPSAVLEYSELNDWPTAQFLLWNEFFYARFSYTSSQWRLPSNDLISAFDKVNDLRYKWLMIENGGRRFSVIEPELFRYAVFSDGRYMPTGPTVAEVLLNKAEVQARNGQFNEAMLTLKILRDKRLLAPDDLVALSKDDGIQKVLEERRRELPFSMRWFDIRRFSVNDYPGDDVTVNHPFFKVSDGQVDLDAIENYSLPVGSLRYAVPISGVEIDASQGVIEQNTY